MLTTFKQFTASDLVLVTKQSGSSHNSTSVLKMRSPAPILLRAPGLWPTRNRHHTAVTLSDSAIFVAPRFRPGVAWIRDA